MTPEEDNQAPVGGGAPDVTIIRTHGHTTIWWTSRPGRNERTMEQLLHDYPDAVREDLWRHPPALKTGEVEALEVLRRIAETKLEEDDDDYEMDVDIAYAKLSEIVNDCRNTLRAQATTNEKGN